MKRLQNLIAALALLLALTAPATARAGAFSSWDGSVLGPETQAWNVWVGLPTIGAHYLQGQPQAYDFGYGLTFDYLRTTADALISVRYSLMDQEEFNLAFTGRGGLHMNFGARYADIANAGNVGFVLSPGIALGMKPHPTYSSFFTLDVPLLYTFNYGGGWRLPIKMLVGLEYMLTPDMNVVATFGFGPRWEGGGGYVGGFAFQVESWAGLSFRLF
ncbi:MAG: hypothetical protein P1V51_21110 [Deltaproteobacteria bacterium]|nr:hypothetical protein [Deltaproteobacteria bacterium]